MYDLSLLGSPKSTQNINTRNVEDEDFALFSGKFKKDYFRFEEDFL